LKHFNTMILGGGKTLPFNLRPVVVLNQDFNKISRITKINPANLENLVEILVRTKNRCKSQNCGRGKLF